MNFVSANEQYSVLATKLQDEAKEIEGDIFNEHVK